jgi:hypothetical protein
MKLELGGKYHGIVCSCGAEDCWPTDYIGFGAPNIKCKTCGKEWIISPATNLNIAKSKNITNKSTLTEKADRL